MQNISWKDPLPVVCWSLPIGKYHPAGFGYSKYSNIHSGVDLYVPQHTPVHSVETGTVVNILNFTGPFSFYPSLNPTQLLMIEGVSGVVLYGAIEVLEDIKVGQLIETGCKIAHVISAIEEQPMLHIELHKNGTKLPSAWKQGHSQPKSLLDPTSYLLSLKTYRR